MLNRDERKRHRRLERTVSQIRDICSWLNEEDFELPHELDEAELDGAIATLRGSVAELEAFIARLNKDQPKSADDEQRDIEPCGPYSRGENDRLRARVEELNNAKHALEIKIGALESEVAHLKEQLDRAAEPPGHPDGEIDVRSFNGGSLWRGQS